MLKTILCLFLFIPASFIGQSSSIGQSSDCQCPSKKPKIPQPPTAQEPKQPNFKQPPTGNAKTSSTPIVNAQISQNFYTSPIQSAATTPYNNGQLPKPPDKPTTDDPFNDVVLTASPQQRIFVYAHGFDLAKDKFWVGTIPVNPSTIASQGDDLWSFLVPASVLDGAKYNVSFNGPDLPQANLVELQGSKSTFRLSRWSAVLAATVFVFVIAMLLVLLSNSIRRHRKLPELWFVDPQTNSYSLQRIQFLLWTAAGVFAYSYACYIQWIIQYNARADHFAFPRLGGNLIAIIGISGGTTVLGVGVKRLKGSEGSGRNKPGPEDLITSGEVVAMEKVQLVVWTIIGLCSFLWCVLSQNPASTDQLPDISDSLLKLAALSGAVYLGGKAIRDPGPVITDLAVKRIFGGVAVDVVGENLSKDAIF